MFLINVNAKHKNTFKNRENFFLIYDHRGKDMHGLFWLEGGYAHYLKKKETYDFF